MSRWMERLFGVTRWDPKWQEELSETLTVTQNRLGVGMVVVIARESDLYAELLFLLSFGGLTLGSAAAFWLRHISVYDPLLLPLMGFAFGSTLFAFRRFFVHRLAPRAVRERVSARAKSHFFDHHQNMKDRLVLLYFSELEKEALFLASPELSDKIPSDNIQKILSRLVTEYQAQHPMRALKPALISLADALRYSFPAQAGKESAALLVLNALLPGRASDRPSPTRVMVLKGNKDIN